MKKYIIIYKNRLGYFKEKEKRMLASEIVYYNLEHNNINIADFRLGRYGKEALAVILVDDEVSNEVIKELSSIKACLAIKYVVL